MAGERNRRRRRRRSRGRRILLTVIASVLVLAVVIGAGVHIYRGRREAGERQALKDAWTAEASAMQAEFQKRMLEVDIPTIYEGVTAMGVNLGGLTREDATAALQEYYTGEVLTKTVRFTYKDQEWVYSYEDLGFTANTEEIVQQAWDVDRSGDLRSRYEAMQKLKAEPVDLALTSSYDDSRLDEVLEEIRKDVDVKAKDATIKREDGSFKITPEEKGFSLDAEATKEAFIESLSKEEKEPEIKLVVKETEPKRTAEMLTQISDVIGSFSTSYSLDNPGRNANLEVGSARVSGTLLMPGETFNFNDTVSPVDSASGYKEASTIVDGEYVPGLGGGLCQVCTTLYNAVIRAELKVTERYAHSLEPGYVPNGQDAAMSIGGKNFQFENSSEYPIYITMGASGGKLWCTIYGVEEHDPSRKVSFESVRTATIPKPSPVITKDSSMEEGTEKVTSYGMEGSKYDVYKIVTENGKTTRTLFNSSTYKATADHITRGTKKKTETPKPAESSPAPAESSPAPEETTPPVDSGSSTEEPAPQEPAPQEPAPSETTDTGGEAAPQANVATEAPVE